MLRAPITMLLSALLAAQAPAPVKAPVPAAGKPSQPKQDMVLAKLGTKSILQSDFDTFLRLVFAEQQRQQMSAAPGALERVRAGFLDSLVMAAKARKEGLDKTADVKKQMEYAGIRVLATTLAEGHKEELKAQSEVQDSDLKAYYEKHPEQFQAKSSFSARHILISTKGSQPGTKGLSDEEALARAAQAMAELKAGKSWLEVAKQYSDDPGSKDNGGLYENVPYGRFVPAFDEAVRKQELGKPGEAVKSSFGYHIIQVETRGEAGAQPFDTVKEQVRQKAAAQKLEEVRKAFLEACRKEVGFEEVVHNAEPAIKAQAPHSAH